MPPLSLLIKPASGNCNLLCRYCFYHSVTENRKVKSYGIMTEQTLAAVVKKALAFADLSCTFLFQGGEPTLAGLSFYKKLIEFQNLYNIKKVKILNAIQTNGICIDEKWAAFLQQNNFLVGISLDGNKDIHNYNRIKPGGDSFSDVMKTVRLLNKAKVEYNILSVITSRTARHTTSIYNFYKKHGLSFLQFIPCLDPLGEERGQYDYSLTPEMYLDFLKVLFDLWYRDIKNGKMISIRYFDNLLGMVAGYPPEICGMSGICTCQNVIEADGSVYPCDFYVIDEYRIGNIRTDDFFCIRNSSACKDFIHDSLLLHDDCKKCNWKKFCGGGCRRDRINGKSYFCETYKSFFEYSMPRFRELVMLLVR